MSRAVKYAELNALANQWRYNHADWMPENSDFSASVKSKNHEFFVLSNEIRRGISSSHQSLREYVRWSFKGEQLVLCVVPMEHMWKASLLADCAAVWFAKYRLRGGHIIDENLNFSVEEAKTALELYPEVCAHFLSCEKILLNLGVLTPPPAERVPKERRISLAGELIKMTDGTFNMSKTMIEQHNAQSAQIGTLVVAVQGLIGVVQNLVNKMNGENKQ